MSESQTSNQCAECDRLRADIESLKRYTGVYSSGWRSAIARPAVEPQDCPCGAFELDGQVLHAPSCKRTAPETMDYEAAWVGIFGERDPDNAAQWVADLLHNQRPAGETKACNCGKPAATPDEHWKHAAECPSMKTSEPRAIERWDLTDGSEMRTTATIRHTGTWVRYDDIKHLLPAPDVKGDA